jgi:phosphonate transport system ATP-binding protein
VAIARALVQNPMLLLADEPVSSLDPAATETVLTLLRTLARDHGITVLCSLHQVELIDGFADRVIGLRDGEVVFDRKPVHLGPDEHNLLYSE